MPYNYAIDDDVLFLLQGPQGIGTLAGHEGVVANAEAGNAADARDHGADPDHVVDRRPARDADLRRR